MSSALARGERKTADEPLPPIHSGVVLDAAPFTPASPGEACTDDVEHPPSIAVSGASTSAMMTNRVLSTKGPPIPHKARTLKPSACES